MTSPAENKWTHGPFQRHIRYRNNNKKIVHSFLHQSDQSFDLYINGIKWSTMNICFTSLPWLFLLLLTPQPRFCHSLSHGSLPRSHFQRCSANVAVIYTLKTCFKFRISIKCGRFELISLESEANVFRWIQWKLNWWSTSTILQSDTIQNQDEFLDGYLFFLSSSMPLCVGDSSG